jgi:hypothetical protein
VSSEYVRSEDFEDLLEETLRTAARERSADKRKVYRDFIVNAIREPGEQYDAQLEILQIITRMSPEHLRVLAAINQPPAAKPTFYTGPPLSVVVKRLDDMNAEIIARIVEDLDAFRLTHCLSGFAR